MKTFILKTLALFVAASIITWSCNKEKEEAENTDEITQSGEDHALMEGEFSSIHDNIDNQAMDQPGFGKANTSILPACAKVYTNTSSNPKVLEITYGDSTGPCLCPDGNYRKGKVRAEFTGAYRTQGSQVVVTLTDYYVNDIKYTGTRTITNLGNASGHFQYSVVVTGASAVTPTGTVTWGSNGLVDRIEGDATLTPWDDVYLITGSSSGVNRRGKNFTVTITKALKKQIGCHWMKTGKVNISTTAKSLELNFDPFNNEACDRIARITYKNTTRNIVLR
jgi:hypothetical protein